MMRLGILGSTRGTHLPVLVDAIAHAHLQASIEVVISNKEDALILKRAKDYGLTHFFINPYQLTRAQFDQMLTEQFLKYKVDSILLMGYMRILSDEFVMQWENKLINVHPSLLPAFAGLMDLEVHKAVLAAKVPETGCTLHYVTPMVDAGPILLQKRCPVLAEDTPESLKARVQALESAAFIELIQQLNDDANQSCKNESYSAHSRKINAFMHK